MKHKAFISCIYPEPIEKQFKNFLAILVENNLQHSNTLENILWVPPEEYVREMGSPLKSIIVILENPLTTDELVKLKLFLVAYEQNTTVDGNRTLNLNPGFVKNDGMYLVSHKPNETRGRKGMGENAWAEKQYDIRSGKFHTNGNTFSEFRDSGRIESLTQILLQN